MAYDERLARRMRELLAGRAGISERKMFGGIAFLKKGHMFAGVSNDSLMARIGPENYEAALKRKHVREMDFTGRPMNGYVFVDAAGLKTAKDLRYWLQLCEDFVTPLPPKPRKSS
jgi:hypothetical protein